MKRYSIFVLVLVLTAAIMTGCGCRNTKPMNTVPTTVPTTEATKPTTPPTTVPTTAPTKATESTTTTDSTVDNGNGPLPSDATGKAGDQARSRRMPAGK